MFESSSAMHQPLKQSWILKAVSAPRGEREDPKWEGHRAMMLCNLPTGKRGSNAEADETEGASQSVREQMERRKGMRDVMGWVSNAARPDG